MKITEDNFTITTIYFDGQFWRALIERCEAGKGGFAAESEHYKSLFPNCKVLGLDYKTFTPWETGKEIHDAVCKLKKTYDKIILIANSIGAFFSMKL